MKAFWLILALFSASLSCQQSEGKSLTYAIVIHGGAGYITPERIDSVTQQHYEDTLSLALTIAYDVLDKGGSATDAIQAAISILEDCTMFNAGRESVYNSKAQQEMDASIMDGQTHNSGAVAGVRYIKNPILAARLVMDSSKHVMLSGRGAEQFASSHGLIIKDSSYFYDPSGYERIQEVIKREKHGTVGAVAIDQNGNIAAATSTGGMFNKRWNRIGDSPIIGAGTYADNNSCGISCTGTGEYFIRTVAAHEVSSLMRYREMSLEDAMHTSLFEGVKALGGEGGMIGIDKDGNIAWDFTTPGMLRGYKTSKGEQEIKIFGL